MALETNALTFSIIILSFISRCFCLPFQDPPYNNYCHEEAADWYGHDFSAIEDGKFKDYVIKLRSSKIICLKEVGSSSSAALSTVNVDDFGAKGDGSSDDTEAFERAWKKACSSRGSVFVVPEDKTYRLKPIRFHGRCRGYIVVQIYGTLEASDDQSDYKEDSRHWLLFENVDNLVVEGGGTVNGKGKKWWEKSCKIDKSRPCKDAPTAVTFYKSKNLVVKNLNIQDAQQIQVRFQKSKNVIASNLMITAPEDSPNTDGIHVTETQNIQISSSTISTGDDCISIVNGSRNVKVEDITCGPGHGISIGSLGKENSEAYVSGITVTGARLFGTKNGVRIKTWQGGSGSVSNIKFQNVYLSNVSNPIIIDQHYCDQDEPCEEQLSAVQVENVVYQNIRGTSASKVAIKFDCSRSYPCERILLHNVKIERHGDEAAEAECKNAHVDEIGVVSPRWSSSGLTQLWASEEIALRFPLAYDIKPERFTGPRVGYPSLLYSWRRILVSNK